MAEQVASNLHFDESKVTRQQRWDTIGCHGLTLWFTGLSGSGKSTVAIALEHTLINAGVPCYRLDGDNIRRGLNKNLGFSAEDRAENIRRISEVCCLFNDAGVVTLSSFISPYRADRDACRDLHKEAGLEFAEVFVNPPLDVCEGRDPHGLYKKARAGEIKGFTGIDDPYEEPTSPELHLPTHELSVEDSVKKCFEYLVGKGIKLKK
ncbi:MAG: adenylyl-sulfate kinase [Planctomycetota bacterium]